MITKEEYKNDLSIISNYKKQNKKESIDIFKLYNDDNKPFDTLEDAQHFAKLYYPDKVIIVTKNGDILCKTDRCNAWQPDGRYYYYFDELI